MVANGTPEYCLSRLTFENSQTCEVFNEGFHLQYEYNVKEDPYTVSRLAKTNIFV